MGGKHKKKGAKGAPKTPDDFKVGATHAGTRE